MKVLKFGGTSVGSTEMITKTVKIILDAKKKNSVVVVVSAMSGVTNSLIEIYDFVENGNLKKVLELFYLLNDKHTKTANELNLEKKYIIKLQSELNNLESILKGLTILESSFKHKIKAKILYFGEILSSILVSGAISKSFSKNSNNYMSKEFLMCEGFYLNGECNLEKSEKLTKKWLKKINLDEEIPVITGFGGGDENGNVYLFDRGGSDYVGTLVGKFLDAKIIEIWTDVDGVMSADPKKVKNPIIWEQLNYVVCAEFAIVGAKVLHPKTISPAQEKNIPIYIKNTFNPEAKGTKICKEDSKGLKGINIDDEQILIKFIDPTMLGGYGYVYSVLEILNDEKTKLDVIGTTETSFGISLKVKDFTPKLKNRLLGLSNTFKISIYDNITKVSLVGDNINFKVLSYFKEEIIMVSTSPYGKLLTIFVKTKNSKKLLNDLHNKIFKNV